MPYEILSLQTRIPTHRRFDWQGLSATFDLAKSSYLATHLPSVLQLSRHHSMCISNVVALRLECVIVAQRKHLPFLDAHFGGSFV